MIIITIFIMSVMGTSTISFDRINSFITQQTKSTFMSCELRETDDEAIERERSFFLFRICFLMQNLYIYIIRTCVYGR